MVEEETIIPVRFEQCAKMKSSNTSPYGNLEEVNDKTFGTQNKVGG